jgi:aryl-alcohol dehydrogenase-like predicted oxidoreductase
MSAFYGSFSRAEAEEESLRTIEEGLELGINMIDTAWIYQSWGADGAPSTTNEELVGKALARFGRENFVVATKTGIVPTETGMVRSSSEKTIRAQLAESLARLSISHIDLYYCHRMPEDVTIEEMMSIMKKLVEEGFINYVGLSECTPDELRCAHAVYPVTAVQLEYSLQTRNIEDTLIPVARELGIGIVAYSPLGRGFLAGTFEKREDLDDKDWRLQNPRFSEEHFAVNAAAIAPFKDLCQAKAVPAAQMALAWVHAQGADIFPIPGTKHVNYIRQNAGAFSLSESLSADEVKTLGSSVGAFVGLRYPGEKAGSFEERL